MHHVRGLVRISSAQILRKVEGSALASPTVHHVKECFVRVVLVDAYGDRSEATFIQTPKLLKFLENLQNKEALRTIKEAQALYASSSPTLSSSCSFNKNTEKQMADKLFETKNSQNLSGSAHLFSEAALKGKLPALFVKNSMAHTLKELDRRQIMLLSRIEGKLCAGDQQLISNLVKQLHLVSPEEQAIESKNLEVLGNIAIFRGFVQQLCKVDSKMALQVVLNKKIRIPLCGAAGSIAKIVDLSSKDAVETFFQAFTRTDNQLPASQTCATSLALRIKKDFLTPAGRSSALQMRPWIRSSDLLRMCQEYNVDPGCVFSTDAYTIQRWSNVFFSPSDLPAVRRAEVMKVVKARRLLPRRVCLTALSAWCGSDVQKEWIEYAMNGFFAPSGSKEEQREGQDFCSEETNENIKTAPLDFSIRVDIAHKAAYALVLKDPRRNLVDNRLLHIYAKLLKAGDISPTPKGDPSSSFSSFLEECGDSHVLAERPERFSFVFPLPVGNDAMNVSVYDMLLGLAPNCSFWSTMLQNTASPFITVFTAPCNELRVEVRLPPYHECVDAARKLAAIAQLPRMFPILWEDDDLLVIDKPAGLATSRHALSCTQNGDANTLDVVSLLLVHRQQLPTKANSISEAREAPPFASLARCGIVHRLDTSTSGCLVIAKSPEAVNSLRHQMGTSAMFSQFGKVYYALCVVVEPEWQSLPLSGVIKDHSDPKVITSYRVLEYFVKSRVAFVECRLQQGKKHQIRRHFASMGMPLVGDVTHGGAACVQSAIIGRTALHASSVSILHPHSGVKMGFTAPLPDDFSRALFFLRENEK